jgi:hypothetical protein
MREEEVRDAGPVAGGDRVAAPVVAQEREISVAVQLVEPQQAEHLEVDDPAEDVVVATVDDHRREAIVGVFEGQIGELTTAEARGRGDVARASHGERDRLQPARGHSSGVDATWIDALLDRTRDDLVAHEHVVGARGIVDHEPGELADVVRGVGGRDHATRCQDRVDHWHRERVRGLGGIRAVRVPVDDEHPTRPRIVADPELDRSLGDVGWRDDRVAAREARTLAGRRRKILRSGRLAGLVAAGLRVLAGFTRIGRGLAE